MVISRKSWHYRLYLVNRRIWLRFWGREFLFRETETLNLCPYIRSFFWALLVVGVHLTVVAYLARVFIVAPIEYTGVALIPIGVIMLKVLGGLAVFVGGIFLILLVIDQSGKAKEKYSARRTEERPAGFFRLIGAYFHAVHDKVCPQLEVRSF